MSVVKRYCHRTGQSYEPEYREPTARSDLAAPAFRRETMDPTHCPADGKVYDTRSEYERAVKATGCEIIGNDSGIENPGPKPYKPKDMGRSIKDAIDQIEAGK